MAAGGQKPVRYRAVRVVAALTGVLAVFVVGCYTLLKARISVPGLWSATTHQRRELRLRPLIDFVEPYVWWGPWFNLIGNIALFVPVGLLLVLVFRPRRPVLTAGLVGFAASLFIEALQFIFAIGYTDVDDLTFNTLGALLGAGCAVWLVRRGRETGNYQAALTAVGVVLAGMLIAVTPFAMAFARWLASSGLH